MANIENARPAHGDFEKFYRLDIPAVRDMNGWKSIEIQESNEPLLGLNQLGSVYPLKVSPEYFLQKIPGSSADLLFREGAVKRLVFASMLLPHGYKLVVFDAHRPIAVQRELFNKFRERVKSQNPSLAEGEITSLTETYVSLPSTDQSKPSPHSTGGAIDLSICDSEDRLLNMGTDFDSFDSSSATNQFANLDGLVHNNRRLLFNVMTLAGFTNYPEEWWHYDYGDQFWAHVSSKKAKYGYIN